jgi:CheY-like chemotaxis protein
LVFTDHRMPGSMTGGQLATRIRQQYPSLLVIVTSGYFDDRAWSEPIVPKPYNPFETATTLAERARRGLCAAEQCCANGSVDDGKVTGKRSFKRD